MPLSPREQARSLIAQGEELLSRYSNFRKQGADYTSDMAKEALGDTAVVVASSLLKLPFGGKYVRRGVKGFLKNRDRALAEGAEHNFEVEYVSWVGRVRSYLESVSVVRQSLKPPGNSSQLVSKLHRAQQYRRLDTRTRRVLALLYELSDRELVHNDRIPPQKEKLQEEGPSTNTRAYANLKRLEDLLRSQIQARLGSVSPNWWVQCVPSDVRQKAEERKSRNESPWPWHTGPAHHPIYYVDFSDYVKIIVRSDNWESTFKHLFQDKQIISAKLRELEPIRNSISHSRDITPTQAMKLLLYEKEILSALGYQS